MYQNGDTTLDLKTSPPQMHLIAAKFDGLTIAHKKAYRCTDLKHIPSKWKTRQEIIFEEKFEQHKLGAHPKLS